nr:F-box domain-containing protein [Tanacetum cinerariifolium]
RKEYPFLEFLCKKPLKKSSDVRIEVRGSCNGLMYLSQDEGNAVTSLVVVHPLKKERYDVPPLPMRFDSSMFRESCGLGFDASTNTLKMVCVLLKDPRAVPSKDHDMKEWVPYCRLENTIVPGGSMEVLGCWNRDGDVLIRNRGIGEHRNKVQVVRSFFTCLPYNNNNPTTTTTLSFVSSSSSVLNNDDSSSLNLLSCSTDDDDDDDVRIVAIVGEGAISPLKSASWTNVLLHTADRLKWVDESYEMLVFTDGVLESNAALQKELTQPTVTVTSFSIRSNLSQVSLWSLVTCVGLHFIGLGDTRSFAALRSSRSHGLLGLTVFCYDQSLLLAFVFRCLST